MAIGEVHVVVGALAGGTGTVRRSNPDNGIDGADFYFREWDPDAWYRWIARTSAGGYEQNAYVFNHQRVVGNVVTITRSATPRLTFTVGSPTFDAGALSLKEVQISGVTLGDAGRINGTHEAIVVSPTEVDLVGIDTTSLTFDETSALVRFANIEFYQPDGGSGLPTANGHTDATFRGTYPSEVWGYDLALLELLQSEKGALTDPQPWLFKWPASTPIWARNIAQTPTITLGATTSLQFPAETFGPVDATEIRDTEVLIYDAPGVTPSIEGYQRARILSDTTCILLDVGATSGDPLSGERRVAHAHQLRAGAPMRTDFLGRINDLAGEASGRGDTPQLASMTMAFGLIEAAGFSGLVRRRYGITSIVLDGTWATITLDANVVMPDAASYLNKNMPLIQINGTDRTALNIRHEVVLPSANTNTILIATTETGSVDVTNASCEIGDPLYWLDIDMRELRSWMLSTAITAFGSGQNADDVPVISLGVDPDDADEWWNLGAWCTPIAKEIMRGAIARMAQRPKSLVVDNAGRHKQLGSNVFHPTNEELQIGRDVYAAVKTLRDAAPASDTRGLPIYFFLGDSLTVGTVSTLTVFGAGNPDYTGGHNPDRESMIWNHTTGRGEEYRATTNGAAGNSNTHPDWNALSLLQVGSDMDLILRLKARHTTTPMLLVKLGVGSSTLGVTTDDRRIADITTDGTTVQVDLDPSGPGWPPYGSQTFTVTMPDLTVNGINGMPAGDYQAIVVPPTPGEVQSHIAWITHPGVTGTFVGTATCQVAIPSWSNMDATIWSTWVAAVESAYQWALDNNYYPDARGAFVRLGTNDAAYPLLTSEFATNLASFVPALREQLATRSLPNPQLPIIWTNVRTYDVPRDGDATVQAAIRAYAALDSQFEYTDVDVGDDSSDCGDPLVPVNEDGVHYTYTGYVNSGCLDDKGLDRVDNQCATTISGSSSLGTSVSSAQFIAQVMAARGL